MDYGLKGKVAIVTGGAMGIGRGIVQGFASEGANVVIADIRIKDAEKTASEMTGNGIRVIAVECDITKKTETERLALTALKEFGQIDVLVNNAGIGINKLFIDFNEEDYYKSFDLNVKAVYLCTLPVVNHMIPRKSGKIINISSQVGKIGFPGHTIYCATKFAVIGITQALAKEMAEHNINVNAVCPGIVPTNYFEENASGFSDGLGCDPTPAAVVDTLAKRMTLFKRPQQPSDIANTVLFLSSEASRELTGQAINVSGGSVMH